MHAHKNKEQDNLLKKLKRYIFTRDFRIFYIIFCSCFLSETGVGGGSSISGRNYHLEDINEGVNKKFKEGAFIKNIMENHPRNRPINLNPPYSKK